MVCGAPRLGDARAADYGCQRTWLMLMMASDRLPVITQTDMMEKLTMNTPAAQGAPAAAASGA
jgi:hypothetical protein